MVISKASSQINMEGSYLMLVVHGARAYKLILYFKKYCILNSYLGCVKNIFLSITGPYCGDRGVFPSYPGSVWS